MFVLKTCLKCVTTVTRYWNTKLDLNHLSHYHQQTPCLLILGTIKPGWRGLQSSQKANVQKPTGWKCCISCSILEQCLTKVKNPRYLCKVKKHQDIKSPIFSGQSTPRERMRLIWRCASQSYPTHRFFTACGRK